MFNRSRTTVKNLTDYTVQTKKLLKDLLYNCCVQLGNFENLRYNLLQGDIGTANKYFDMLDSNKDGLITFNEFQQWMRLNRVKGNHGYDYLLFDQFDIKKDDQIDFEEFHKPQVGFQQVNMQVNGD